MSGKRLHVEGTLFCNKLNFEEAGELHCLQGNVAVVHTSSVLMQQPSLATVNSSVVCSFKLMAITVPELW